MKKLLIIITMISNLLGLNVLMPAVAYAAPADDACIGLRAAGGKCTTPDKATNSFGSIIKQVIKILSIVVGAVSVVMLIIGGFRYVISGGDSNGITGAKNTILYAIIGLVIVVFAQIIVRFVLSNV